MKPRKIEIDFTIPIEVWADENRGVIMDSIYSNVFDFIQSPDDDHDMNIDELNALMDGVEIAQRSIDRIIAFILKQSYKEEDNRYKNYETDGEEDDL